MQCYVVNIRERLQDEHVRDENGLAAYDNFRHCQPRIFSGLSAYDVFRGYQPMIFERSSTYDFFRGRQPMIFSGKLPYVSPVETFHYLASSRRWTLCDVSNSSAYMEVEADGSSCNRTKVKCLEMFTTSNGLHSGGAPLIGFKRVE
ncbi:hypothetical protein RRG08_038595 [Elysia crispata]|uniref:Uncharacterized protein n=1 Tax=Elysia crispata TaxID=231223 RepID=A0AAE1ASS0_9GAST|nr:hypothetical protein RRG08_038595 [Elysia crispata]